MDQNQQSSETQSNTETYKVNPNQITYDASHVVDHMVDVMQVYFAEQVKKYKWEPKTETYTVKGGGKVADVIKKYQKSDRRNVQSNPNHTNALKKDDKLEISWEERKEDGVELVKVNKVKLGAKTFVVAKCQGDKAKLSIEINENKLTSTETIYDNPVVFLIGDAEKKQIEFSITKDKVEYSQEITLRPKSDDDFKKLKEKFDKRTDKNAFLYFKAQVTETQDEIKFPDETHEFLNKTKEQCEVKYCDCGEKYRADIECTRYGKQYGPVYWGTMPLSDFAKWDDLVTNKTVSESEKAILIAMSENEGKLDAVQSYDSEIVTAGAMQKTINPNGYGELPIQIWEFKNEFPDKYECYLKGCKWEVVDEPNPNDASEKYKAKYDGLSGSELKTKIREGFEESKFKKKTECKPIEPIINLMKDSDYQIKQIKDFVKRLQKALDKTPTGYSLKISDYITSNLGKATVLDNDVNRPGQVANCFGAALDAFFKANPKVPKTPSEWGDTAAANEKAILETYGPLRGEGSYTMTSATKRYKDLKAKL